VRFNSEAEANQFRSKVGHKVFYSCKHAEFAMPVVVKGSDASYEHDEEPPEEVSFIIVYFFDYR
jgi:hypothetical protein